VKFDYDSEATIKGHQTQNKIVDGAIGNSVLMRRKATIQLIIRNTLRVLQRKVLNDCMLRKLLPARPLVFT
jgi:hypothetical protein